MKVTWLNQAFDHSVDHARWPSAGRVLAVASALPALAVAGWLLAGVPLLLLGWFRPIPAIFLGVGLAFVVAGAGLRRLPEAIDTTPAHTAALFVIAIGSAVFNGVFHTEQLIVRRDPATYAQYAIWLAGHGSLPIHENLAAFGGADPALRFDSTGFYASGGAIVPQFMPGPPLIQAFGEWLGGLTGLLFTQPILGGVAVLTVGGVAARLIGGRWAVPVALAFAVCTPVLYTSRSVFSEIPSLILLFGGMSLLLDARHRLDWTRLAQPGDAPLSAAVAGLVLGLALVVRIDALRDLLPVLAYAGLLIALRRHTRGRGRRDAVGLAAEGRLGVPLLGGLVAGAGLGLLSAYLLARPYLAYLSGSLTPLLAICAVVLVLTAAAPALAPWLGPRAARLIRRPSERVARLLPRAVTALVVLVAVAFAVRPWVRTVRRDPATPEDMLTADFIAKVQAATHLPHDPTRLYYENSLYWVIWYVGVPVVVLAVLGAVVLSRRLARGHGFAWLLPLAVIAWTTVTTLWRPGITPDHPWASRRLVPIVLPGVILLAAYGLRRVRDLTRRMGYGRAAQRVLLAVGALLLVVPAAVTSIGTAFSPVERGEAAAVSTMCAALPRDGTVLMVERVTGERFAQVVRGMCGLPTARVRFPPGTSLPMAGDVLRLAGRIERAGRVPVLLAAERDQVARYGPATQVLRLRTRQDERTLVDPPNGTWSLSSDVWMAVPST
jgi:hypothetical protein